MAESRTVEDYERDLLRAKQDRLRSPEHYIRYQMTTAEPMLGVIRRFVPTGEPRILEVGCGTGGISLLLASRGFRVTAIDRQQYDGEALSAARAFAAAHGINLDIQLADASALPFASGSFDCVICSNVMEHLDDPWGGLAEIHRVLRAGGFAFVDFPLFRGPYGGHIDDAVKVPWFHLMARARVERTLIQRGAERHRAVFVTLNGLTVRRFLKMVQQAPFEVASFGRSYYLTAPGRKLIMSLREAVRRGSVPGMWRSVKEAVPEFSLVQALQFLVLAPCVPLSLLPVAGEFFTSGAKYVLRKRVRGVG